MSEDASLDDFLDAGAGRRDGDDEGHEDAGEAADAHGDVEETDHAEVDETDNGDVDRTDDDVDGTNLGDVEETAVGSESVVDPDGARCADCERSVSRRWRRDGALVCGDCVEW